MAGAVLVEIERPVGRLDVGQLAGDLDRLVRAVGVALVDRLAGVPAGDPHQQDDQWRRGCRRRSYSSRFQRCAR
ncbi:hypothetical protein [Azospirillum doebereinerae]